MNRKPAVRSYCVFIVPRFVAFVVNMAVLLLQVELHPVVQTHDLLAVFGLSNKHVLKATRVFSKRSKTCIYFSFCPN